MLLKKIGDLIHRLKNRQEINRFFAMPYAERVAYIKRLYSHENISDRFVPQIEAEFDFKVKLDLFFDVCSAYAIIVNPAVLRQIGFFGGSESQFIIDRGYQGFLQGTDFDPQRLDFLRKFYKGKAYERIELKVQDLENPKAEDFAGVKMIVAQAVLSNIQKETMDTLIKAMSDGGVDAILIGDCYVKETLSRQAGTPSVASPVDRNWFHPYLALGKKYGYDLHFVSDFMYSSFHIARGIFILTKGVDQEKHLQAIKLAYQGYFSRQDLVFSKYEKTNINKKVSVEEEKKLHASKD